MLQSVGETPSLKGPMRNSCLISRTRRGRSLGLVSAALLVSLSGVLSAAAPKKPAPKAVSGEQVYAQRCASCHGAKGEGTKAYAKPLTGDRSVGQLSRYIAQNMPPGPKKCSAPEAEKVAAYIHEAFYSPIAQARNRPPRVELSRLTVRQYRNTLTDLIAAFRPAASWSEQRGLHGEYFKNRRYSRSDRVIDRIDPELNFNFGVGAPAPELDPKQYSVRWEGSVIAPDTGDYEFVVRTDQAMRLWVNDLQKPIIDATVKSGSDNEYRAPITLLGGRAYPIRMEWSKSNQGVNNPEKQKDIPAGVVLEWKAPHQAQEVIPQRCLMPVVLPEVFVSTVQFPPDDRSQGYERGTSVSKEWDAATTDGAIETAAYVAGHLRELSGTPEDAPDRKPRLMQFCKQFAERAFRRPLSPDLEQVVVQRQFAATEDLNTAVKRVVLLVLKSPRTLYRDLGGEPDPYDVAARLSYGLWDSLPDAELLKAAASNSLSGREQLAAQANRMVQDPRARSKVREFFLQWLKVDQYPELAKDGKKYPGFDQSVATDLRTSLDLFLDSVIWSEKSDYRELMLSDRVFVNGRLAKLYGVNLPENAPFQAVTLDSGHRTGVLTQPYLLASFAYLDASSPIHRGVLIARNLLGRVLLPPQQAFTPLSADLHPNLTTRERVTLQTSPPACQRCHDLINELGFSLENYDAIGRFRTQENGKPVNTTGAYESSSGKRVKFSSVRELASYLATGEEAQAAFVDKLFQYLIKQPIRAFGDSTQQELRQGFAARGCSIRGQVVESAVTAALKR